jgi:hypothetical protein
MGGSAGDETKSKPPQWWTDAAKEALAQGRKVAKIGYIPYMGPDGAAFAPQQVDAFQDAANWSAAFNTPGQSAMDVGATLMPATDFGNGLRGYSSYGGYMDAIGQLRETYPALANYIDSFFISRGTPGTTPPPDPGTGGGPGGGPGPGGGGGGNGGGGSGGSGSGWHGGNFPDPATRPGPGYTWNRNQQRWMPPPYRLPGPSHTGRGSGAGRDMGLGAGQSTGGWATGGLGDLGGFGGLFGSNNPVGSGGDFSHGMY